MARSESLRRFGHRTGADVGSESHNFEAEPSSNYTLRRAPLFWKLLCLCTPGLWQAQGHSVDRQPRGAVSHAHSSSQEGLCSRNARLQFVYAFSDTSSVTMFADDCLLISNIKMSDNGQQAGDSRHCCVSACLWTLRNVLPPIQMNGINPTLRHCVPVGVLYLSKILL